MDNKVLKLAREKYQLGDYKSALKLYTQLKERSKTKNYDANIELINRKLGITSLVLGEVFNHIGIEKVYVINLKRRLDRKIKQIHEFKRHHIEPCFIEAEDALTSQSVQKIYKQYLDKEIGTSPYTEHITLSRQKRFKTVVGKGAFAYNLSQKNVIEDALKNNYKSIAVFDDDVFFTSNISHTILEWYKSSQKKWGICLLGASEYSEEARKYNELKNNNGFYHPIPDRTCGSFGVLYNHIIYQELLDTINAQEGTYDNVVLGHLYHKYKENCFVIYPNVCIPSIEESDIRSEEREQIAHSQRMGWDISNFNRWKTPLNVALIISNIESLEHIQSIKNKFYDITVNVFYLSYNDGLRPIILGRVQVSNAFIQEDMDATFYSENPEVQKAKLLKHGLPFSDYTIIWPSDQPVTLDKVRSYILKDLTEKSLPVLPAIFKNIGNTYEKGLTSVIIPSYRPANEVWSSIQSVLYQQNAKFELIIINDNPNNGTFKLEIEHLLNLEKEKFPRKLPKVLVLEHSLNRHASAGRNTGFYASKGEYISFLDDDDLYEENRLFNAKNRLEKTTKKYQAVYCGYKGKWNGEKDLTRFREGNFLEDILYLRYAKHYMCTNTITYRREAFVNLGGFNESYRRHQDLEFNLRFFMKYGMTSVKTFDVHNRPVQVTETFTASIDSLLALKTKFLYDFRDLINAYTLSEQYAIVSEHANDIFKRGKFTNREKELIHKCLQEVIRFEN